MIRLFIKTNIDVDSINAALSAISAHTISYCRLHGGYVATIAAPSQTTLCALAQCLNAPLHAVKQRGSITWK